MSNLPALVLVMVAGCAGVAFAQSSAPGPLLEGKAAMGDWKTDQPGLRRKLTIEDLPPRSESKQAESKVVPRPADAKPRVPAGFTVELVAELDQPRVIRVAPNGDLFVAESMKNQIRVLRFEEGNPRPTVNEVFAAGLSKPYGIAFFPAGDAPQWVYVGNDDGIVKIPYKVGDTTASSLPEVVVTRIPWAHHWTRDLIVSPDGERLMYAVGSGSNVALDMSPKPREEGGLEGWIANKPLGAAWDTEERRATILSFTPDGKNEQIFATGLRNASGITVQPKTQQVWAVVNERDGLGDNTPFEYATHVEKGQFFGWPWYYMGDNQDPRLKGAREDLAGKSAAPDVLMQAHTAPLQIAFYDAEQFPAAYRGSAFVTMHGSWDRSVRVGYKVVRLEFDGAGKPTGAVEDFMTGFVVNDAEVWGRPVGVAVGKDGSLFVTEDGSGTMWRVRWTGAAKEPSK